MNITKENFADFTSSDLKVVDFWAEWCGPCQSMMPIFEEFEKQTNIPVGKINVDQEGELAAEHGIRSIPTIMIFKDGKVVDQIIGAVNLNALKETVEKYK